MLFSQRSIFLIGPMGAGKSTIGKHLAQLLKLEFLDTDQVIEERAGADIAWIFDVEGEEGFRQREIKVLDELTKMTGLVLATGGGIVLAPENRNNLSSRGTVVYLSASIDQQLKRTGRDKRRPMLQGKMAEQEQTLQTLMKEREALYEEIADYVVMTDSRTVRSVAQEIIDCLEKEHL